MHMHRVLLALLATLALTGTAASASLADVPDGLTIVDPGKLEAHPAKNGEATATVTVRNDGALIASDLRFAFVGEEAVSVTASKPSGIAADDVARFELQIKPNNPSKEAKGQLIVSSSGRPAATVAMTISPTEGAPSWVLRVIFISFGAAALFVLIAFVSVSDKGGLTDKLGPVDWDFSKSWASNLTVFSALLGTILAAGVLPTDTSAARKATYAGLNLLFGLGILIGPFLYTAFQTGVEVHRRGKATALQYQGSVWAFLIASVVTLWATAGEFATIYKLFDQLHMAASLPQAGLYAFEALVIVAGISLVVLSWTRLRAILKSQSKKEQETRKKVKHQGLALEGITDVPEAKVKPELEAWPAF